MKVQTTNLDHKNTFTYRSYFLSIAVLLLFLGEVQAQETPSSEVKKFPSFNATKITAPVVKTASHEIKIGYGIGSSTNLETIFSRTLLDGFSDKAIAEKNATTSEVIFASYKYTFKNHFTLGGSINAEQLRSKVYSYNSPSGKMTRSYVTLAAEIGYRYIKRRFFAIYSGVGIATCIERERYKPSGEPPVVNYREMWNFQLTALGFHVGDKFGAFAEIGYGYRGIVNAGAFVHF